MLPIIKESGMICVELSLPPLMSSTQGIHRCRILGDLGIVQFLSIFFTVDDLECSYLSNRSKDAKNGFFIKC